MKSRIYVVIVAIAICVFSFTSKIFAAQVGDVTLDGKVNAQDVAIIKRYVAGWDINLTDEALKAADVTGDGIIDSRDGIVLNRYVTGYDVTLPFSAPKYGDLNNDGKIDSNDIQMLEQVIADPENASTAALCAADVTNDGSLSIVGV